MSVIYLTLSTLNVDMPNGTFSISQERIHITVISIGRYIAT